MIAERNHVKKTIKRTTSFPYHKQMIVQMRNSKTEGLFEFSVIYKIYTVGILYCLNLKISENKSGNYHQYISIKRCTKLCALRENSIVVKVTIRV